MKVLWTVCWQKFKKRDGLLELLSPSWMPFFCQEHYAQLKRENPDWSVVQVAKASGKMWSAKADIEKQPYEQRAAALRAKYHEDLKVYHAQRKARKNSLRGLAKNQRRRSGQAKSDNAGGSN